MTIKKLDGLTFDLNNKTFTMKNDCSVAEILLFAEVTKELNKIYSMEYLIDNPQIIVEKYNKSITNLENINE